MKPLFSVTVRIIDTNTLKSERGQINMIIFGGFVDAPFFKGQILPGACDTQKYLKGESGTLSARYLLSGTDDVGRETKVFIENNACLGNDGEWKTTPVIYTDNPRLNWLESERLTGEIEGCDGGVRIHFYREADK